MSASPIEAVFTAQAVIDDGSMHLRRVLPGPVRALGPFVFIDHYRSTTARGIGDRPHPHAGIEVVSYLLEGAVHHRDSMGNRDVVRAGDVQAIRAGRGMLHAEVPQGPRHGLQLWTSLPPHLKHASPSYARIDRREIADRSDDAGALRVVTGTVDGLRGPLRLARDTLLAHVALHAGMTRRIESPAEEQGVYVAQGAITLNGVALSTGMLAVLAGPAVLQLRAADAAHVMLIGGERIAEPVLFGGPFVMDTPDRLAQAQRDLRDGVMGTLS